MINYKIFNWKGDLILSVQADFLSTSEDGQIKLFKNEQSWPVAIFPDGTLIVESGSIFEKPRKFDFVNQKDELKKRNEHLFVEPTPGFDVGDFSAGVGRDMVKHNKRGRPEIQDGSPNKELSTRLEKYLEGKTPVEESEIEDDRVARVLQKSKETIVSTGNGKLDENAEDRVLNVVEELVHDDEEAKLEEKRRKNREYQKEHYRKLREKEGKPYTPSADAKYVELNTAKSVPYKPKDDHNDSGSENYRSAHMSKLLKEWKDVWKDVETKVVLPPEIDQSVEVNNDSNNIQNTDDDAGEWKWEG